MPQEHYHIRHTAHVNDPLDQALQSYVQQLLSYCHCPLVSGEAYEIEAGANAVNGLQGKDSTADTYLYAAIERRDWQAVVTLYERVFRPHLLQAAITSVEAAYYQQPHTP